MRSLKAACRSLWHNLTGVLQELSDQDRYQRHLRKHGLPHSGEAWRAFSDQRLKEKYMRPKCC